MAYAPTHDAPEGGLSAYAAPDPTKAPVAQLDPGLDVQLLERRADWAHIACSNGWEAWVDARLLVARPTPTPEPPPPPAATAPTSATPAPAATTETPAVSTAPPTPAPSTSPSPTTAAAPSQGWTVPETAAPATAAPGGGMKIGVGQIIALASAGVVLISGWLDWFDFEGGDSGSAYKVPAKFLIDNSIDDDAGLNAGILVLLCVALVVVGVFVRFVRWLAIVGGGGVFLIGALYIFQANGAVNDINDELRGQDFVDELGLLDFITVIPVLTMTAGAVAVVGGVVALRQP